MHGTIKNFALPISSFRPGDKHSNYYKTNKKKPSSQWLYVDR